MFNRLRLLTIGTVAGGVLAWTLPISAGARSATTEQEPQPVTAVVNVLALAEQEALSPFRGPMSPRSIHRPQSRPDESEGPPAPQTWFADVARGPRVASPAPAQTFSALDDGGTVIPPDTHGAVGRTRLMTTVNDNYRVQDRSGATIATVSIATFWAATGATGIFDPRVLFDPYNDRWIVTAVSSAFGEASSVLVGVSQTEDPAGNFFLVRIDADSSDATWADFPTVGFNRNWVVVSLNMFSMTGTFSRTKMYAWSYPALRAGSSQVRTFELANGFTLQPAVTYSATEDVLYFVEHVSSGSALYRVYAMTGGPTSPQLGPGTFKTNPLGGWTQPTGNILPQLGGAAGMDVGDSRVGNVVFRNNSLWYAQTVGLPAGGTARTAVQWAQLEIDGDWVQGGRIQDPTATSSNGGIWYAYPSITVNKFDEVLVGFSRYSSTTFASAAYAFRTAADAAGTMRDPVVYRTGDASYYKTFSGTSNRWGDYSFTSIDPLNDADMWTLQEYARLPQGSGPTSSRWGTTWARVAATGGGAGTGIAPAISDIANRTVDEDTSTGAVGFTVSDADTPAASLTISAASSNEALAPIAGIVLGGADSARTVTVTPAADQSGSATITLTVSDGVLTASDSFVLTVTAVNDAPALDAILDRTVADNAGVQVVNLTGIGTGAANETQTLSVSAASSNTALIPNPNVSYSSPAVTGSLTFAPLPGGGGTAVITVTVSDGGASNATCSRQFQVTVNAVNSTPTITNITDRAVAMNTSTPPIAFTIGDDDTPVASLTLSGASNNLTLVHLSGIVFGGAGANRAITVTPAAGQSGTATITVTVSDGTHTASDDFQLTVGGSVNAPPTLDGITNRIVSEDAATLVVPLTGIGTGSPSEVQALVITASSSNPTLIPHPPVTYTSPAATGSLSLTPAANQHGAATITVTVNDGAPVNNTTVQTFAVAVASVNDAPTIADITDRTISRNTATGAIPVVVGDIDSSLETLTLSAASSNQTLVPSANVTFGGSGANRTVTVTPAANQSGTATITVSVSDGIGTTSDSFLLTVTAVAPTLAITTPSTQPATSTSPFLAVAGTAASDVGVSSVTWTTNRGGSGTAVLSAATGGTPDTRTWTAEVPVPLGVTTITVTATDAVGGAATATTSGTVSSYVYYLAEGATGAFFDTEITLANPNAVDAPVQITYLKADGTTVPQAFTLSPLSHATILVDALPGLDNTAVSTVIESPLAQPLAVERTMKWDGSGYGAHTEKATAGARLTWYFAEGSQGFFDTFLLLTNPGTTWSQATVKFLRENDTPITRIFAIGPTSRTSVWTGAFEDLRGTSFGMTVSFTQPGVAERAMYFGTSPQWTGGHGSAGVPEPATRWFHAEGATGPFFDTFILMSNPNPAQANVTIRYLLDTGATITRTKVIPALARLTVNLEGEDPLLANTAVATQVTSSIPIVSERAMYWAGAAAAWYEAHNSLGVTTAGTRWALGEGRVGGAEGYETYILLANPGDVPATVTLTYLREAGAAPIVRTLSVPPTSRVTTAAAATAALAGERFGALIESTQPIVVERAMYSWSGGVFWAAGTNATATRVP